MQSITKAVAAWEVIKKLKQIQSTSVIGIALLVIQGILNNFILVTGIGLILFLLILFNAKNEEKELKEKYGL